MKRFLQDEFRAQGLLSFKFIWQYLSYFKQFISFSSLAVCHKMQYSNSYHVLFLVTNCGSRCPSTNANCIFVHRWSSISFHMVLFLGLNHHFHSIKEEKERNRFVHEVQKNKMQMIFREHVKFHFRRNIKILTWLRGQAEQKQTNYHFTPQFQFVFFSFLFPWATESG